MPSPFNWVKEEYRRLTTTWKWVSPLGAGVGVAVPGSWGLATLTDYREAASAVASRTFANGS